MKLNRHPKENDQLLLPITLSKMKQGDIWIFLLPVFGKCKLNAVSSLPTCSSLLCSLLFGGWGKPVFWPVCPRNQLMWEWERCWPREIANGRKRARRGPKNLQKHFFNYREARMELNTLVSNKWRRAGETCQQQERLFTDSQKFVVHNILNLWVNGKCRSFYQQPENIPKLERGEEECLPLLRGLGHSLLEAGSPAA